MKNLLKRLALKLWKWSGEEISLSVRETIAHNPDHRPSMEETMMRFCIALSGRSVCSRLQVGCIITDKDMTTVLGIGYNGPARGLPHKPESSEPGKTGFIHAEVNALIKTDFHVKDKKLFVTHSPCYECAKLIINAGIAEVYYIYEYRDNKPIELLKKSGAKVYNLDPSYFLL